MLHWELRYIDILYAGVSFMLFCIIKTYIQIHFGYSVLAFTLLENTAHSMLAEQEVVFHHVLMRLRKA